MKASLPNKVQNAAIRFYRQWWFHTNEFKTISCRNKWYTNKGYGLQTTRRHQLRGRVVCLMQKKTTGASAGYGCCSCSSDAPSGAGASPPPSAEPRVSELLEPSEPSGHHVLPFSSSSAACPWPCARYKTATGTLTSPLSRYWKRSLPSPSVMMERLPQMSFKKKIPTLSDRYDKIHSVKLTYTMFT